MRIRAILLGLALAAGAALVATGAQAAEPSCGLNNGKKATGKPIPIGSINGITGPDDFSASARASDAYFKCVNANGGINGRPVNYLIADDQWRPDVASQVATKLVKDDKVVAMIGSNSIVECGSNAPLYEKENVMVIDIGVVRECFNSPNIAPMNEGPRLSGVQMAQYAYHKLGVKKIACMSFNIPGTADWFCAGLAQWGEKYGVTVDTVLMDPSSADFTSLVLRAAAGNPDAMLPGFTKGGILQVLQAAQEQDLGSQAKFITLASGYVLGLPKAMGPYWNDRFWTQLEFTPLDGTGPDNLNWKAIMDKYGDPKDPRDTFSQGGYLAAKLATDVMLKMDPDKITRDAVTKALRAVTDFRSDMMCGPWYIGDGKRHNANHKGQIAIAHDGKFKTVSECVSNEDPELADVYAAEKAMMK